MRDRAIELYKRIEGGLTFNKIIDVMMFFSKECCELQKQECYSAYRLETNLSNTNKAILNCKNVADEN